MTLYVDDLTIAARDTTQRVAATLAIAVDNAVHTLENDLGMTVNRVKSKVVASKPSIAIATAATAKTKTLKPARWSKLLGTPASGGNRRCSRITKKRIHKVAKPIPRLQALTSAGTNTAAMASSAGTAAIT